MDGNSPSVQERAGRLVVAVSKNNPGKESALEARCAESPEAPRIEIVETVGRLVNGDASPDANTFILPCRFSSFARGAANPEARAPARRGKHHTPERGWFTKRR